MQGRSLIRTVTIDTQYKQAYVAKGMAMEAAGEYSEAQKAYDAALQIDPAYAQALIGKMHVLLALKKPQEAMEIFVKL